MTKCEVWKIYCRLLSAETDKSLAPDARRVLRDERMGLGVAIDSRDPARISQRAKEARRVAEMWGVTC